MKRDLGGAVAQGRGVQTRGSQARAILGKTAALAVLGALLGLSPCFAGFRFFSDPDLRFWGSPPASRAEPDSPAPSPAPIAAPGAALGTAPGTAPGSPAPNREPVKPDFDWSRHLDPGNDEFFREGDYLPPAPFLEIARRPTEENIRNWFRYLDTKNRLAAALQEKLEEFARKRTGLGLGARVPPPYLPAVGAPSAGSLPAGTPAAHAPAAFQVDEGAPTAREMDRGSIRRASGRIQALTGQNPLGARYHLRLYFDTRCPHCDRMMGTLATLSRIGFFAELRQVDPGPLSPRAPFPVERARAEEIRANGVESVPLLLVGDLKTRTYFKIQGFRTPEEVLGRIREVESRQRERGNT